MARPYDSMVVLPDGKEPDEPIHNADGVDLTQIRHMLSLTPAERLRILEGHATFFIRMREHGRWRTVR